MANNGLVSLFFLSELLDILFDKQSFFAFLSLSLSPSLFFFPPIFVSATLPLYLSITMGQALTNLSQIRGCLYEMRPFYIWWPPDKFSPWLPFIQTRHSACVSKVCRRPCRWQRKHSPYSDAWPLGWFLMRDDMQRIKVYSWNNM